MLAHGESPGFCIVKFYQPFAAVPVTNKAIVNMTGSSIIVKVLITDDVGPWKVSFRLRKL